MIPLNDLAFFVAAVDHGGFAAASRRLGMPKSTISKRVAELEARLSVRLIHRTSRRFTLTELGRDFYEHARAALIEAEAAEAVVRRRLAEPSGVVRLSMSVPTAQVHLASHLPRLATRYPRLDLQIEVTDRFVDLLQENVDIALRSHFAPLPDSGLVQRQLVVEDVVLVAAPGYLEQHGPPTRPEQLADHQGLLTAADSVWLLRHTSGAEASVAPKQRLVANESTVLIAAALDGLGITPLPEWMCRPAVDSGRLVRVLPEYTAGRVTTTLLMPHRRGQLPGVRAVVEFLVDCFRGR